MEIERLEVVVAGMVVDIRDSSLEPVELEYPEETVVHARRSSGILG